VVHVERSIRRPHRASRLAPRAFAPARSLGRSSRLARGRRGRDGPLDAIQPFEALDQLGAGAAPVIDGEAGPGGADEQQDEQELVTSVERHARTIPRAGAGG
jgi:hypothetical protein